MSTWHDRTTISVGPGLGVAFQAVLVQGTDRTVLAWAESLPTLKLRAEGAIRKLIDERSPLLEKDYSRRGQHLMDRLGIAIDARKRGAA